MPSISVLFCVGYVDISTKLYITSMRMRGKEAKDATWGKDFQSTKEGEERERSRTYLAKIDPCYRSSHRHPYFHLVKFLPHDMNEANEHEDDHDSFSCRRWHDADDRSDGMRYAPCAGMRAW